MKAKLFLLVAIIFEVIATSYLKKSEQFTRPLASVITVLGYAGAFYFLSLALSGMSIGVAYAIWSGVGIVLVTLIGLLVFGQKVDLPAVIGMVLIVSGVLVINLFSKGAAH